MSQAAHEPVDPPPGDWFTEEEIETLDRVVSKDPLRRNFAKVIYYLDKSVRGRYVYVCDSRDTREIMWSYW